MKKAYLCLDREENIFLGVVRAENNSKAKSIVASSWMKDFGMSFIEACNMIYCSRYKALDDLDFKYLDGRELESNSESITTEVIIDEIKKLSSN